ncbi:MAG: hypothetical protein K8R54_15115 [Bacteroidales bacterium]|nr:hypothetical protein [Bacteroidales bacterium]
MNDTTPEMKQYQYNLIMNKTPAERFIMGLEMSDTGRELMIAGIKAQNPNIKNEQIIPEILKRQLLYDKSLSWLKYVVPKLNK